jgi:thiamine biosynthesis lipoprotein ApbE
MRFNSIKNKTNMRLKINPILTYLMLAYSFFLNMNLSFAHNIPMPSKGYSMYQSHFENVLGTSFDMKVKSSSEKTAVLAESIALNEIARLSKILSAYDANSEFSKWMRTKNKAVVVSPELFEVFELFDQWKIKTNGALDPAVAVFSNLWKSAALTQNLPSETELKKAVAIAQQQHWKLDQHNHTAVHLTDAPLMLNTFVKSYIIKHSTDAVLSNKNISSVVMNIGGDILVAGEDAAQIDIVNPKADAINDLPIDQVQLNNKFVATSGNYRRGEKIQDKWYSHIIDPRNGLPVDHIISATVVADDATDAGALATSFNVLTPGESVALAKTIPGVEYLIITQNGTHIQSEGWEQYSTNKKQAEAYTHTTKANDAVTKSDEWDPNYELLVNLELSQIQGPYKRPFVAIWVQDENNNPVRTVNLWYNKPRWLHDLRAWYAANNDKYNATLNNMASFSSATRSAGKYSIKWDGKDDKGDYVKKGTYKINVEVAREHGTYQLITQEIKIKNKAIKIDLAPNTEVAAASIEYKKVGNE